MPWTILFCTAGLMLIGLSGIAHGDALTGRGEFFTRQVIWIVLAAPAMFLASAVPYRRLRGLSYPLFAASVLLLMAVYAMPPKNGARRWIPLGFMDFQPSELAKLAYMMSLAHYLMYRKNYRRLTGLVAPFVLTLVPVVLILREPDLGTALVFFPVLFAMLFAAGARARHLAFVIVLGAAASPGLWMVMSAEQKSRIVTLFVQRDGGPTPAGDGYHLHQSKQVLALGGPWGSDLSGMALDEPLAYHLPAGRTDFIFCLVGERWGFLGCCLALLLYAALFARGLAIASATREPFGRLMAVGIVALLAAQTIINTGMTVGLMPVTGLTLPLVSYGGSSLMTTCVAIGLLLNIGIRPGYEMTPEPFRFAAET
jgi:rod shape-determining protein RodA